MPEKPREKQAAFKQRDAVAMIQCLNYLEGVAIQSGYALTAHMINLAIDATSELIRNSGSGESARADGSGPNAKINRKGRTACRRAMS